MLRGIGYGSNLCRERFLHYIERDKFQLGGKSCTGCNDKTFLDESKPIKISHGLFFANSARWWGNGGVSFISLNHTLNENNYTYGRMWKITREQFSDVWDQEGRGWYDKELPLGQDNDGTPIVTITSSNKLEFNIPSDNYLKTMIVGLKETYQLSNETILQYLIEKPGIKNNLTREKLLEIINSN